MLLFHLPGRNAPVRSCSGICNTGIWCAVGGQPNAWWDWLSRWSFGRIQALNTRKGARPYEPANDRKSYATCGRTSYSLHSHISKFWPVALYGDFCICRREIRALTAPLLLSWSYCSRSFCHPVRESRLRGGFDPTFLSLKYRHDLLQYL